MSVKIHRISSRAILACLQVILICSLADLKAQDIQSTKTAMSFVGSAYCESPRLNRQIDYQVYIPGGYHAEQAYPVIYLLHGHGGSENDWMDHGSGNVQHILDSLTSCGAIPPSIAVTLDAGNSWYVDRHENMETAVIQDFIPTFESGFNIDSERRIIAGLSAGGFGALRFALKHPGMFRAVLLLSPAAYYPTPPDISSSRKIDVFATMDGFSDEIWRQYSYHSIPVSGSTTYPKFYLSTGDDDPFEIVEVVIDLRTYFNKHNMAQELTIVNGAHTWSVWRSCFKKDIVRAFAELRNP